MVANEVIVAFDTSHCCFLQMKFGFFGRPASNHFLRMFETWILPTELEIAKTNFTTSSYRKNFERIILERLLQLKPEVWFHQAQHDCIRGSSTEAVLFNLRNKLEASLKSRTPRCSRVISRHFSCLWHGLTSLHPQKPPWSRSSFQFLKLIHSLRGCCCVVCLLGI